MPSPPTQKNRIEQLEEILAQVVTALSSLTSRINEIEQALGLTWIRESNPYPEGETPLDPPEGEVDESGSQ
jgi:hypothetical protein